MQYIFYYLMKSLPEKTGQALRILMNNSGLKISCLVKLFS